MVANGREKDDMTLDNVRKNGNGRRGSKGMVVHMFDKERYGCR